MMRSRPSKLMLRTWPSALGSRLHSALGLADVVRGRPSRFANHESTTDCSAFEGAGTSAGVETEAVR